MTTTNRPPRYFTPPPAAEPVIGGWLAAMEEARERTKTSLLGINQATLDWQPPRGGNGIGTLLYHIAVIEADWLSVEVREEPDYPPEMVALFPHDVRDAAGRLTVITGLDLAAHLARLDAVRTQFMATFAAMSLADFTRIRVLPEYDVTPQWTVHHLLQHEAEHRGEIGYNRLLAGPAE
jgi:uncharacterized damage-inducible protein DinB